MVVSQELANSIPTKKKLLYANVALFKLFVAFDYAVLIPSLWLYLRNEYDSSLAYYGLCLSSFHVIALPSSLICGVINDWGLQVKTIVFFGNLLQVTMAGQCQ